MKRTRLRRKTRLEKLLEGSIKVARREKYGRSAKDMRTGSDGYVYDSKAEAKVALELELRQKAGDIFGFDRQVWLPLMVNGKTICRYVADFIIMHNDGSQEVVEVKGFRTEVWRLKEKLFRATWLAEHPGVIFTVREAR